MRKIGKTETGKLYHILNTLDGSETSALCGVYLPKNLQKEGSPRELYKKNMMCSKCMNTAYFKQERD